MLNKLTLSNFRQHRDLIVDFTNGINIIRAANEGGKSTLLEAINYAMFGSKALRTSLDETVTWGEDTKTIKVVLDFHVGEDNYTFTRGKSGAEVVKNGAVFVTGQNEVSAFAATLLGADASITSKLMFASQNGIRGALEEGPKALSVLIEDLSDMAIFDKILEAAQTKLSLGSPSILEERLKGAAATLEAATESLPMQPDADQHRFAVSDLNNRIACSTQSLPNLELKATSTDHAWRIGSQLYMGRMTLESNVEKATETLTRAKDQVDTLAPAAATLFTDSRPALRQELLEAEDFTKRAAAYQVFKSLPEGDRYAFNMEMFVRAADACAIEMKDLESQLRTVTRAIEKQTDMRLTGGNCTKCGQSTDHLTHIIETNTKIDAELVELKTQSDALQTSIALERVGECLLKSIRTYSATLQPLYQRLAGHVEFDNTTYPATVVWVGTTPSGDVVPDCGPIRAQITKQDAEIKAIEAAGAKHELAIEQCLKAEVELASATQTLAAYESPSAQDILDLTEAKDNASLNFNAAKGEVIISERELAELKTVFDSAMRLWTMAKARVDDSTAVIAACKKDIESLNFNNGLVKKLRLIRPMVADKLWNTVLSSVSVMFSQMRGYPSLVSKDKGGFRVNGQAVESLSGSTLDILGVALRCSLLRTFIPQCGLLVLDEPCAAMDSTRTESMLGFLQTLGMTQTLLVSHESLSTSIADNLIEL